MVAVVAVGAVAVVVVETPIVSSFNVGIADFGSKPSLVMGAPVSVLSAASGSAFNVSTVVSILTDTWEDSPSIAVA